MAASRDFEAHLTIVFAALTISRWIESQAGWPGKFACTARSFLEIQAGPGDLRDALEAINHAR